MSPAPIATDSPSPGSREARAGDRIDLSEALFLLYVVLVPLMRLARIDRWSAVLTGADLLFIPVAVLSLASAFRSGALRWRRFHGWLAAWSGALILSFLFSNSGHSVFRLFTGLYLVCVALVTVIQLSSWQRFRRFLNAWLIGAAINVAASILTVVFFFTGARSLARIIGLVAFGSLPPGDYPRVRALFVNMNMYCTHLVISAVFILLARQLGWMKKGRADLFLLLLLVATAFTISPGIGGMGIVFGCFYWLSSSRPVAWRRGALIAGILFACGFFVATFISPVSHAADGSLQQPRIGDLEPSSRVLTWKASLATFLQHPILGAGVGARAARVHYVDASGLLEHLTDAHNTFLSVAAHDGVVGLAAFGGIIVSLLSIGRWRLTADRQGILTALAIALWAGFLYQALTGSFEDTRHVWLLFGALAAVKENSSDPLLLAAPESSQ